MFRIATIVIQIFVMSATLETETTTTFDYFYYNDNEIINQGIEETATSSFDYRTSATNRTIVTHCAARAPLYSRPVKSSINHHERLVCSIH